MKSQVSNIINDSNSMDQFRNKENVRYSRPCSAKYPVRPNSSKSPPSKRMLPRFVESQVPLEGKSSKSILGIYGAASGNKAIIYKQIEHGPRSKPRIV